MKKTRNMILFGSIAMLAACGKQTDVTFLDRVVTAPQFAQQPDLLQRVLNECSARHEQLRNDQNCVNANTAVSTAIADAQRRLAMQQIARVNEARTIAAKQDLSTIMQALKLYRLDNGVYPTQEQGLQALLSKPMIPPIPQNWHDGGYLERLPNDPWGNPYQYLNPGIHGQFDVYSYGMDVKAGDRNPSDAIGSWQPDVGTGPVSMDGQLVDPKTGEPVKRDVVASPVPMQSAPPEPMPPSIEALRGTVTSASAGAVQTPVPASNACSTFDKDSVNSEGIFYPHAHQLMDVVGKGRVQFYSAPAKGCQMSGVFVIPGDRVNAYIEYKGFASVTYFNSKTGSEVDGWIDAKRIIASLSSSSANN
jgi:general secretion pathway protein G